MVGNTLNRKNSQMQSNSFITGQLVFLISNVNPSSFPNFSILSPQYNTQNLELHYIHIYEELFRKRIE